jgi:hypothetical protein
MKKYDYDNNEMSTASEPAWTLRQAQGDAYGTSTPLSDLNALQMPMTEEIEDDFELSPEIKQMLDQAMAEVENGTDLWRTHEEFMQEMDQLLVQLKQQRKEVYARV